MADPAPDEHLDAVRDERHAQALWYAWGREAAGDHRLRDASTHRDLRYDFANFAADQLAAAHADGSVEYAAVGSLAGLTQQYARFVAAVTPGAYLANTAPCESIEVVAYDPHTNQVQARVVTTVTATPAGIAARGERPGPASDEPATWAPPK